MSDWERMLASMDPAFRGMAAFAEGGRAVELNGVLATVAPKVPERSLPNAVLYDSEDALLAALEKLAPLYDEAGVLAWTVWVPEHHERVRSALDAAGHVLDANPAAMIADLADIEEPREDDPVPDHEPRREHLGLVNDLAYGTGDAFGRMMGEGPADPRFTYIARNDGEPVATVVTTHHRGDCGVWWVATAPEARGRGLASGLMRRALADARAAGCETTTLQATKAGRPVYDRLGYRAFGSIEMWERRKPS